MGLRIGNGFDVHRLVAERALILGGVVIPADVGLEGHSDADVLTHAVCNALLGAMALGDIGMHFPSSDSRFKAISSMTLLRQVLTMLTAQHAQVLNIDSMLIAQRPRLASHVPAMQQQLANVMSLELSQVSIKVTSTDGLGAIGRGEGIAAQVVALLQQSAH